MRKNILTKLRQVFIGALAVCVGLMYGASAQAESSFSANVTLTTDYVSEGISDSDGAAAIQSGLDWSHSAGPYAGVWASNAAGPSIEIDYFAGFSRTLTDRIKLDLGMTYHHTDITGSFTELNAALNFDVGFAGFGFNYGRALSDNESNRFILTASLMLDRDLPVTMSGEFGINLSNYTWYQVGVGTEIKGFGLEVFYAGRTLIDSDEDDPDPILGASISHSF